MQKKLFLVVEMVLIGLVVFAQQPAEGPTAYMSYKESTAIKNPIGIFMYFVPLTSPARVSFEKSDDNSQTAWITDYELNRKDDKFTLRCEIAIDGSGHYEYRFNPEDIIAVNTRDFDEPKSTTNLDYMRFEGAGYGSIEIRGTMEEGFPVITDVVVDFSERGEKSPVSIGLYSLDPVDGAYDYENRYNYTKARVASLTFQKPLPDKPPMMKAKLSSLGNASSPDGFFASVKAVFANFFVTPIEITTVGNIAMFDFARAIYFKEKEFTFPPAENLITAN
jgi:hypothetical protein